MKKNVLSLVPNGHIKLGFMGSPDTACHIIRINSCPLVFSMNALVNNFKHLSSHYSTYPFFFLCFLQQINTTSIFLRY